MKKALTIAGSDSSGGAGIQGDLKTFLSFGLYGTSAVTAVTAQSTRGVHSLSLLSPESVSRQIDAVLGDIGADAIKTGMLGNSEIVEAVCGKIREYKLSRIVVDPVISPKSGPPLLDEEGVKALITGLLPLATIVTPNIPEAELLAGLEIKSVEDMKRAALSIAGKGPGVLVKGGHLRSERKRSIDILRHRGKFYSFESDRLSEKNTHGTGCILSAAIAAGLALGEGVLGSVERAKGFVTDAIKAAYKVGKGTGPVNPASTVLRESESYRLLAETERAFELLSGGCIGPLIPEIQSNLVFALEGATTVGEVIGFANRIIKAGDGVFSLGRPVFGGSSHVARIALTAMRCDPEMRSAMNLRYSQKILEACRSLPLLVASFSRKDEPAEIQVVEGSSLEWGVDIAIQETGRVPDIIYDTGGDGKEPVIRVMGKNPAQVAENVLAIRKAL